jgi:hypothetical protein
VSSDRQASSTLSNCRICTAARTSGDSTHDDARPATESTTQSLQLPVGAPPIDNSTKLFFLLPSPSYTVWVQRATVLPSSATPPLLSTPVEAAGCSVLPTAAIDTSVPLACARPCKIACVRDRGPADPSGPLKRCRHCPRPNRRRASSQHGARRVAAAPLRSRPHRACCEARALSVFIRTVVE